MSVNITILVGRVGKDPEINIYEGKTRATFKMVTNETYKDSEGTKHQLSEWHSVVAWAGTADLIGRFVKKGNMVMVRGQIKYSYTDKNGVKTHYTNIVCKEIKFLSSPSAKEETFEQSDFTAEYEEDELPF